MKRIGIAALLALGALTGRAQGRQGFYVQPQFQIGSSITDGDLYKYTYSNVIFSRGSDRFFLSGGVNAGYMFNNHLGLYVGVGYSSFTWQSRVVDYSVAVPDAYTSNITQRFVQVPVYLRYVSSRPGKVGFLGTIGPRFSFLTGASENDVRDNGTSEISHDNSVYNSTLVGLGIGLGVNIPLNKKMSLDLLLDSQVTGSVYKDGHTDQQLQSNSVQVGLEVAL